MSDLQSITTTVYYLPPPPGEPASLVYFCTSPTPPGSTVSMQDAWEDYSGYFIFIPQILTSDSKLSDLANAIATCPALVPPVNPNEHATSLAWTSWDEKTNEIATPLIVPIGVTNGTAAATETVLLEAGRYGMPILAGATFSPAILADGTISELAIGFQSSAAGRRGGVTLSMGGDSCYCFRGPGLIGDPSADSATGFDIALYYFVSEETFVRYPLFEPWTAGYHVLVDFVWDPLMAFGAPGYDVRTSYTFTDRAFTVIPGALGQGVLSPAGPPLLTSGFRGLFGETVLLSPQAGAKLVPQPMPGGWYLAPEGVFALSPAPPPSGNWSLLCGVMGTEYFELGGGSYAFRFVPGSSAHVSGGALTSESVTSWIELGPWLGPDGTTPEYYSQPPGNALYGASGAGAVLPLCNALVCDVDPARSFPMVPYAQLTQDAVEIALAIENLAIAPTRKALLSSAPLNDLRTADKRFSTGTATTATTPQGFQVQVDGTTWSNLQLANDGTNILAIPVVSNALRLALQSPQLFLVITEPIESFTGSVTIADWPFTIAVGQNGGGTGPNGFQNVLIFKFGTGSVLDSVKAGPAAWTSPEAFNDASTLDNLQNWLQTYLDDAIQAGEPAFSAFRQNVQDPSWNGVLALSIEIGENLPGNLQGIVAGIDQSNFYGHHLGINVTPVSAGGTPPPSSFFALIDYNDIDPSATVENRPPPTSGGSESSAFAFRVLTLQAQFANSQIVLFESQIVLTMTQLFGETVQLAAAPGTPAVQQSSITLSGHLELHDGNAVYTFSSGGTAQFLFPDSFIFYYIDVTTAQFQTLSVTTADGVSTVTSRFTLWGALSFQQTPGIDLFSFGNSGDGNSALVYANLGVFMTFQLVDPPQPTVAFTFDTSAVSFDLSLSSPRESTDEAVVLYTALPLQLDTIVSGQNVLPQDDGYFSVLTSGMTGVTGLDPTQWYGISMVLNLGTMGALANLASFNAELIAAWSPGGSAPQAALLLQLPGTAPGKTALSLQSVLRLGIGQVLAQASNGTVELTLANVGLVFLGVTLPLGASIDVSLISNSSAVATSSLGWYAVYAQAGLTNE